MYADVGEMYSSTVSIIDASTNPNPKLNIKFKETELDTIYKGLITGFVNKARGELISYNKFELNKLKGIEFQISFNKNGMSQMSYVKSMYLNGNVVNCMFTTPTFVASSFEKQRRAFLNSLRITVSSDNVKQFSEAPEDNAYKVGYFIGQIIGVVIVLGILIGLIYLVIRIFKKLTRS